MTKMFTLYETVCKTNPVLAVWDSGPSYYSCPSFSQTWPDAEKGWHDWRALAGSIIFFLVLPVLLSNIPGFIWFNHVQSRLIMFNHLHAECCQGLGWIPCLQAVRVPWLAPVRALQVWSAKHQVCHFHMR